MRLLVVEVRRLLARRFFRVGMIVTLLGIAAMIALTAQDSYRPSDAEWARARTSAAQETPRVLAERQACYTAKANGTSSEGEFPADCAMISTPRAEDFLDARPFVFTREILAVQTGMTVLSVLAAFLIGATAIGAEWNHGTLGALLLWEPRRVRVFLAKLAAVLGVTTVTTALAYAAGIGGAWAVARGFGIMGDVTSAEVQAIGLVAARGLALTIAAAACSFAIALTAKRTAAALGVLFAYIAVGEVGVRWFSDSSEGWLVSSQLIAWMQKRYEYYVTDCTAGVGCKLGHHTIGLTQAGVYLAILTVVSLAAAATIFRRREVT